MIDQAQSPAAVSASQAELTRPPQRLDSIDWVRGLIMVIMALDHVRDFFSNSAVTPENLAETTPTLFFTRWITHFCASGFVFLAGCSAFLYGARGRTKAQLSRFLWTRGLWLVLLELTLVTWGWQFDLTYRTVLLQVIWAVGVSMVCLAGLVHLPLRWLTVIGLALVLGHNLCDGISFPRSDWRFVPWTFLHGGPTRLPLGHRATVFLLYAVAPWAGVLTAGYSFGRVFLLPAAIRQRWLIRIGSGLVLAFVLLRLANGYGDPSPWSVQKNGTFTVMSFLGCTKYPPSLLYVLMTVGPILLLLAFAERFPRWRPGFLTVFGRVPLFYYLLHIYLVHLAAGLTALATGSIHHLSSIFGSSFIFSHPPGYGFSLGGVYVVWIAIVALLYPPCRWYADFKRRHPSPWLSYL